MSIPCNVTSCSRNSCTELQTLPRERETWWQNMKQVLIWVCLQIWSPLVPHIFQWFIILFPSNVVVWGHVHPFSNKPIFSVQWPSIFCEDLHVSLQVLIAQETLAPVRHGIFVGRWATLKFDGWSSFPYWKWFRIAEKVDLKKPATYIHIMARYTSSMSNTPFWAFSTCSWMARTIPEWNKKQQTSPSKTSKSRAFQKI